MSTTIPKIFGQLKPAGLTTNILYSVPIGKQAQVTIFVTNQGTGNESFRVGLVPNGQTLTTARYVAFDTPLIGNGVFAITGIGLDTQDTIYVRSSLGALSFTATGVEFSP